MKQFLQFIIVVLIMNLAIPGLFAAQAKEKPVSDQVATTNSHIASVTVHRAKSTDSVVVANQISVPCLSSQDHTSYLVQDQALLNLNQVNNCFKFTGPGVVVGQSSLKIAELPNTVSVKVETPKTLAKSQNITDATRSKTLAVLSSPDSKESITKQNFTKLLAAQSPNPFINLKSRIALNIDQLQVYRC